ncbi:MAG: hypothetical protein KGH72_01725 [Candidatus Micrarchaeota archaeon]|nr:hypothetical protein [Candidatus Micrarchaeota archaeon]
MEGLRTVTRGRKLDPTSERLIPELTPAVTPVNKVMTLEEALDRTAELAEKALSRGTFGVAGLLTGPGGMVYAEAMNMTQRKGKPYDPTGHVERQLIDWYFEAARAGAKLPPPGHMLILSSLDPCAMCSGSTIKAGFKTVAIDLDGGEAGIHDVHGLPHRMPRELWAVAESSIHLITSRSGRALLSRQFPESEAPGPKRLSGIIERCRNAFEHSYLQMLYGLEKNRNGAAGDLRTLLRDLHSELPDTLEIPPAEIHTVAGGNRRVIEGLLGDERVCLIDPHGRPLLIARGREELSPIRIAVIELVRSYSQFRSHVHDSHGIDMPGMKSLSVLMRDAPATPIDAFHQLGSMGTFVLEKGHEGGMPLLAYLNGDDGRIRRYAGALPPHYTRHEGFFAGTLPF